MTREDLFKAVGQARDDQVTDANAPVQQKIPWRRYAALAACLALVLAGSFALNRMQHTGWDNTGGDPAGQFAPDYTPKPGESDIGDAPAGLTYSTADVTITKLTDEEANHLPLGAYDYVLEPMTAEELLSQPTVIFRGVVRNLQCYEANGEASTASGFCAWFMVATVEVTESYRGDLAAGDIYNVYLPSTPYDICSGAENLGRLRVGDEAIFMPYVVTPDVGRGIDDSFFSYADVAELYFSEGIRFLFRETENGVDYDYGAYDIPAAGETVTLDDVAAYLQNMLAKLDQ